MLRAVSGLESGEGTAAAGEFVRFDAEALEHGDEEVGEGGVVALGLSPEGEMASVSEPASGQDDGKVLIGVGVGIPEAASVEDLGVVEEGSGSFRRFAEGLEKDAEGFHLGFLDLSEFGDFFGFVAMVGEPVGFVFHAVDVGDDGEGAEGEGDDA